VSVGIELAKIFHLLRVKVDKHSGDLVGQSLDVVQMAGSEEWYAGCSTEELDSEDRSAGHSEHVSRIVDDSFSGVQPIQASHVWSEYEKGIGVEEEDNKNFTEPWKRVKKNPAA
jgi:hypothetical protein